MAIYMAPDLAARKPQLHDFRAQDLLADDRYQRPTSKKKVQSIAASWNHIAAGTILVNHRAEGSLTVMDGRNRVAAFIEAGEPGGYITGLLYEGLTDEEEAQVFLLCNSQRSAPVSIHAFHARQFIGEDQALAITQVVEKAGLFISHGTFTGKSEPGVIQSVSSLDRLYALIGSGGLSLVLDTLLACFGKDPVAFRGYFLLAMGRFINAYPQVDVGRLVTNVSTKSASAWLEEAMDLSRHGRGRVWANLARLWRLAYNARLGERNRLPNRFGGAEE